MIKDQNVQQYINTLEDIQGTADGLAFDIQFDKRILSQKEQADAFKRIAEKLFRTTANLELYVNFIEQYNDNLCEINGNFSRRLHSYEQTIDQLNWELRSVKGSK